MIIDVQIPKTEKASLEFEQAKIVKANKRNVTVKFQDGTFVQQSLLNHINPKKIIGKKVEVLVERFGRNEFCYGTRLVNGEVICDSVAKHYDGQYYRFDMEKVRDFLYEAT